MRKQVFDFTGEPQLFVCTPGIWQFECYGAGDGVEYGGCYTSGVIRIEEQTDMYMFVGGPQYMGKTVGGSGISLSADLNGMKPVIMWAAPAKGDIVACPYYDKGKRPNDYNSPGHVAKDGTNAITTYNGGYRSNTSTYSTANTTGSSYISGQQLTNSLNPVGQSGEYQFHAYNLGYLPYTVHNSGLSFGPAKAIKNYNFDTNGKIVVTSINPSLDTYIKVNGNGYDISGTYFDMSDDTTHFDSINKVKFFPSTGSIACYYISEETGVA